MRHRQVEISNQTQQLQPQTGDFMKRGAVMEVVPRFLSCLSKDLKIKSILTPLSCEQSEIKALKEFSVFVLVM